MTVAILAPAREAMHGAAAAVAASRGHDRNMSVNLESEIEYLEALGMGDHGAGIWGDHGAGIAEHANFGRTTTSKKLNRQKTQQAIDELEMLWVTGAFDPELKGSIGEGSNHSNFSDLSSVNIVPELRNFC